MPELFTTSLFNDANLVSYYRLEGNSNDAKGSNNGTDTIITYSTANGKYAQGAGFNGTTSKIVNLTPSSLPVGTTARSFVAWVNPSSFANTNESLLTYGTSASGSGCFWGMNGTGSNNKQQVGRFGANSAADSNTGLTAGIWQHVAVTIDGSGNIVWYYNGVADGTTTISGMNTVNSYLYLGSNPVDWGNPDWNGAIDDLAIFSRVLTAAEILSLFQASNLLLMGVG